MCQSRTCKQSHASKQAPSSQRAEGPKHRSPSSVVVVFSLVPSSCWRTPLKPAPVRCNSYIHTSSLHSPLHDTPEWCVLPSSHALLCLRVSPTKPQPLAEASRNTPTTTTTAQHALFWYITPPFPTLPSTYVLHPNLCLPCLQPIHSMVDQQDTKRGHLGPLGVHSLSGWGGCLLLA